MEILNIIGLIASIVGCFLSAGVFYKIYNLVRLKKFKEDLMVAREKNSLPPELRINVAKIIDLDDDELVSEINEKIAFIKKISLESSKIIDKAGFRQELWEFRAIGIPNSFKNLDMLICELEKRYLQEKVANSGNPFVQKKLQAKEQELIKMQKTMVYND